MAGSGNGALRRAKLARRGARERRELAQKCDGWWERACNARRREWEREEVVFQAEMRRTRVILVVWVLCMLLGLGVVLWLGW